MSTGAMDRLLLLSAVSLPSELSPSMVDAFEESVRGNEREKLGILNAAQVKRLRRHARLGSTIEKIVKAHGREDRDISAMH